MLESPKKMPTASAALLGSPDRPDHLALEHAFFRFLRLPNGTYKTTGQGRLVDFDRWSLQYVPAVKPLRFLDVGVSSGTTTVDWIGTMREGGHFGEFVGTDILVDGWIRRVFPGVDALIDRQGRVLQLASPWLCKGRPHDPSKSTLRFALQSAFERIERAQHARPPGTMPGDTPVRLLSSRARAAKELNVVEHDLLEHEGRWESTFQVVRAANILNLSYFPTTSLQRIVRSLGRYLMEDGVLFVVRTLDESREHHGTAFRRQRDQLVPIGRYGSGSEIEALAVDVRL